MDNQKSLVKLLVIAAFVLLAGWAVYVVAINIMHSRMGRLTVNLAPSESTLTIDNKKVKSSKPFYIKPGSHHWKATFENFGSKDGDFSIAKGEEKTLDIYLEPANDAGRNYLVSHPLEASRIEGLVGKKIESNYGVAQDETPLINQLPYIEAGFEFRIDYGTETVNGHPKVTIYVESISDEAKQHALDWIRQQGTDPGTLNIVYTHRQPDNYNVGHQ
jgi:hypothetical protein